MVLYFFVGVRFVQSASVRLVRVRPITRKEINTPAILRLNLHRYRRPPNCKNFSLFFFFFFWGGGGGIIEIFSIAVCLPYH